MRIAMTPLAISLLIAALLLLLEQMLRLLDFVLHENGPVEVVWRMLAFLVPHYLGLALPLALFFGVTLAFRRLSLTSEYDSLRSAGLSPVRLLRPMFIIAGVMMLVNFLLLAYVQPYAQYAYQELRYELQTGLLGARFPVGEFVSVADDVDMRIGRTAENGEKLFDVVVIYEPSEGPKSAFSAREGQFLKSSNRDILILRLRNGVQKIDRQTNPNVALLDAAKANSQQGVLRFEQQDLTINLPEVQAFRGRGGQKKEATIDELIRILREESEISDPDYNEYRGSFHFRILHTLVFLVLPFLGLAVGVTNHRRPSNAGPIIGLALVILYHELLEEWGEGKVASGALSPFESMWPVFLGFMAITYYLYHTSAVQPGDGGVQRIERVWIGIADGLKSLGQRLIRRPAIEGDHG